ncbi:MAG: YgjV family protein [Bacilli bacterium]|nr:YgjV family protein [Bacilli bacterium]
MDIKFLITQFIGLIGYSTLGFSYFKKNKKDILLIQIFAYIMFILHYQLLNAITGSVCNLLGLIAFVLIYLFDALKKKKKVLITILIPILLVISFITFENIYSIFPIIASVVVIISFLTDDEDLIRRIGIIAAICWLIYAIVYKSYVAIVFEVITLIVVVIAYIKRRKK